MRELDPSFAEWLGGELARRRMTHRMLAERAGVDHTTVSRLARGRHSPTLAVARRLALALDRWPSPTAFSAVAEDLDAVAQVERAIRAHRVLTATERDALVAMYRVARERVRRTRSSGPTAPPNGDRVAVEISNVPITKRAPVSTVGRGRTRPVPSDVVHGTVARP